VNLSLDIPKITKHLAAPNSMVISKINIQSSRYSFCRLNSYNPKRNDHCRIVLARLERSFSLRKLLL
jgi:hypothetical protein